MNIKLARIADYAGYKDVADKYASCSTCLQFYLSGDKRRLMGANFCQQRLCPVCTARRAKKMAYKICKVLNLVEGKHAGCRFLFLTLTVENCTFDDLGNTLDVILKGWEHLRKQRKLERAVKGWYRALEITREQGVRRFHPHLHAILCVDADYFTDPALYIDQRCHEWTNAWRKALRLPPEGQGLYPHTIVDIKAAYAKDKNGRKIRRAKAVALEAGKYAVKDKDIIDSRLSLDESADIFGAYWRALRRRRMVAFGGWMREAARDLGVDDMESDGDLVHIDDDSVREDIAEMIETYNWNFGAGDYVLARCELNPLRVVRDECPDDFEG